MLFIIEFLDESSILLIIPMILEIISLPFELAFGGVVHNFAINFFTLQVFKGKSILSGNEGQSPVVLVVLSV